MFKFIFYIQSTHRSLTSMTCAHQSSWFPHGHLAIEELSIGHLPGLSSICLIHWTLLLSVDLCDFFFASCQKLLFVRILRDFDRLTERWVGAEFKYWILETMRRFLGATRCLASSRAGSDWRFERINTFSRRARLLSYLLDDALFIKLVYSLRIFVKALPPLRHIWSNWYVYGIYILICFPIILSWYLRLLHTGVVSSLPAISLLVCCLKIIDAFEKANHVRLLGELQWQTSEVPSSGTLHFLRNCTHSTAKRRLGFGSLKEIKIIYLQLFKLRIKVSFIWFIELVVLSFTRWIT